MGKSKVFYTDLRTKIIYLIIDKFKYILINWG